MTNLTILYATDDFTSRLHGTRAARDWEVFCPTSINEALAMAVYYAPHAIVIDGDSDWLNELAVNLTSVTGPSARMKDVIIRLADARLEIDVPEFIAYYDVPADTAPEALANLLTELNERRERDGRMMLHLNPVA